MDSLAILRVVGGDRCEFIKRTGWLTALKGRCVKKPRRKTYLAPTKIVGALFLVILAYTIEFQHLVIKSFPNASLFKGFSRRIFLIKLLKYRNSVLKDHLEG